jgi:methylmalonyl-CoA carboxyltransferase large subunit
MTTPTGDWGGVVERLEALRRELGRLGERVAALEATVGAAPRAIPVAAPAPAPAPAAPPQEEISEELVLVISAAIAAFLGKRPHIRQIRLLGSAAWAQQGRVTIQASHALGAHHR